MNDTVGSSARMAVRSCGAGPVLVLFHGGMGSWNHWTRNLEALAARFTVHAVDLPGYGDSAAIDKSIAHDRYIDHVIAGLQPIVGDAGFGLAGFSFGSVVAAMTAARMGTRIRKLSLLGAGGFGTAPRLDMQPIPPESAGAAALRAVFRHNLRVLMIADPAAVGDAEIDLHADNFRHARFDGRGFSTSNNTELALQQIACPVQLIYGGRDALAPADFASRRELVRRLNAQAEFVVLPGAGHWVQYEAPAEVNHQLIEFFGA